MSTVEVVGGLCLLLGLGTRLQFLFLAVAVSNLVTEVLKYSIGRGRPFVGGEDNVFHDYYRALGQAL